ncbi:SRPBCC domain-containing protein [Shouchella patagoniensis]|uniref:SRPBCC domain-containing protein n=1 Tax=Shouchella patagoniensis TaxID=228576 RepID=UPI000994F936|nr:SRPBCC domain-containing protein [Shouchella patagoniensis]
MDKVLIARREIFIQAKPSRVWQALTVPAERNKWETRSSEMDVRIGGKIYLEYGWGVKYTGTFKDLIRNEKIITEDDEGNLTTWLIIACDGGCKVVIEYQGEWCGDQGIGMMENMLFGTYQFMENMKSVLESGKDKRGEYWKSWLGILNRTDEVEGAVKVVSVIEATPAEGALIEGDLIYSLNGKSVKNYESFEKASTRIEPGSVVTLHLKRGREDQTIQLKSIPFGTFLTTS